MKHWLGNPLKLGLLAMVWGQIWGAAETSMKVRVEEDLGQLTVYFEQQPILVYCLAAKPNKPYVRELFTLAGDNLLRDAPSDHLHHHALMYAIKVNGVNFWEEVSDCGVQYPVRLLPPKIQVSPEGLPEARFTQLIHWVTQADRSSGNDPRSALLIEKRRITVTVNKDRQEVALDWESEFEVGPKTNRVVLTGSNYHGLGLRFLAELDPLARHVLPDQEPDLANGKQAVVRVPWALVSFARPEKPAAIALMGNPANPRGESLFFSMRQPFAYLSATQGLDREAIEYRAGNTFKLNYLVLVYPRQVSAPEVAARYQQWIKAKKN